MQRMREMRDRIETVRGVQSLTKALSTVASAKLSKISARAQGARVYADKLREMTDRQQRHLISAGTDPAAVSTLLAVKPEVKRILLLHLAGDRGMCGGYNLAVDHLAAGMMADWRAAEVEVSVITKGTYGERFMRRRVKANVLEAKPWPREGVVPDEVAQMTGMLVDAFLEGRADEVWCTYTRFYSAVRREPLALRLLPFAAMGRPARAEVAAESGDADRWYYETSLESTVPGLVELAVRAEIEDVLLEAFASEQAARMITMEEANVRASRMLQDLVVSYNRVRRETITADLIGVLTAKRVRKLMRKQAQAEAHAPEVMSS